MKYITKKIWIHILIFPELYKGKKEDLDKFIIRGKERIIEVAKKEENNQYAIFGRTYKDGRKKSILLIIRYADGSQRDERYSYLKIADLCNKMSELKDKHKNVDWSEFEEEIN